MFFKFIDSDDDASSLSGQESFGGDFADDDASLGLRELNEVDPLAEKIKAFKGCADVGDRKYRMKVYHNVFVGAEVVDNLVYTGVASSRWEAVQLGRKLAREADLFKNVGGDEEFKGKCAGCLCTPRVSACLLLICLSVTA